MTPSQWRAVKRVVQDALDHAPEERAAVIDAACSTDPALRRDVEALLAAADPSPGVVWAADHILARPAAFAAGRADAGPALAPQLSPAVADHYVVDRELGRGGMAVVYRARDVRHDRWVALKVLRPDLSAALGTVRFRREITVAAGLQHPHIVPVLDSGEADGALWFTMPYVEGESLRQRMAREGPFPLTLAVQIAKDVALALDYAHRHGVVHRDIKPENILLSDGHALVADFGIAKAAITPPETGGFHTGTGLVIGTPAYMSPEQAAGDRALDARSDIYALGLVLYEMLAGTPASPATRRAGGTPAPLPEVRRDVPPALGAVVARALRPAPADRYPTAAAFAGALDATSTGQDRAAEEVAGGGATAVVPRTLVPWAGRRALAVGGVCAAIAAAVTLWRATATPTAALDPNRVVVFPLATPGAGVPAGMGEDAATLLGYALEGTAPLRWLEATDYYLAPGSAARAQPLSSRERRTLSAAQRAGFYIDGTVMRRGDSATVVLRLHSVAGDSLVARRAASARIGDVPVPDLALRAVGALLVPLLAPGQSVDVSAWQGRAPGAVAEFLEGEREVRASHFGPAVGHYRAAVERDSAFALAALKGAQAAISVESGDADTRLTGIALAQIRSLPPYRAAIARGFDAYLRGAGDSAVAEFGRAIAFDSSRSEPWMALGEVYRHLLPRGSNLDSLAEAAFLRARQADTAWTLPLYHLGEIALRRGAIARADTLARAYRRADPDSISRYALDLAVRCARDGPQVSEWSRALADAPASAVLEAGVLLADRPSYAPCAGSALSAVLNTPVASRGLRWLALFALQNSLIATGRHAEVARLFRSPAARAVNAGGFLLLDASAGEGVDEPAADIAREWGENYRALPPYRLWVLGVWEAARGHGDRVRTIARALSAKVDSSHARSDSVMSRSIGARATLAAGDTTLAIRQLRALTPAVPFVDLMYFPAESFGADRLLLAQLLLARHDYAGAQHAAAPLGGSHPIAYLLYRRASGRVQALATAGAAASAAAAAVPLRRADRALVSALSMRTARARRLESRDPQRPTTTRGGI